MQVEEKQQKYCKDCNAPISNRVRKQQCKKCRNETRKRERVAAGICYRCGKNNAEHGLLVCDNCATKARETIKNSPTRQMRRVNKLCLDCGIKLNNDTTSKVCDNCVEYKRGSRRTHWAERIASGLCYHCDNPPVEGKRRCAECLELCKTRDRARAEKLAEAGICVNCGKSKYLDSLAPAKVFHRLCEDCYFKTVANHRLRDTALWGDLKEKFYAQNKLCAYTGVPLIIGLNASIDHIKPVKHFPELKADINNIEFICGKINLMKSDRTPEQFHETIQQILKYRWNEQTCPAT